MKLAFIGLGIMGRPLALHLIAGNHAMRVHARHAEAMTPLVDAGAIACSSAAEAAQGAEVVFVMVSDTPDVEAVVLGERGVVRGASPGAVVVDMSTISPIATRAIAAHLADRGIDMLDAPVSGGEAGARSASLSIMVGGKREVFDRIRSLLALLGKNIVYVGESGAGQVAKACNQIVGAVTMEAVAEAITLARKNGVDPAKVREALLGGFAWSRMLEVQGERMVTRNFEPGFKAKLHRKDLRLVMESAAHLNIAMPQSALIAQHLNALVGMGYGERDSAAVVKVIERMSALHVEEA
ncbi:MAG TPA: NAD(P)-dependent oxidoreductase [Burkholderiales bacterium]|nr:NAD(P)-dependent oxidoreductase [Burkholderiales bacterium]